MYEWSEIAEVAKDLLVMVRKTCHAPDDAKLMAIRKKYNNKKFGMISLKAQRRVGDFAEMEASLSKE